MSAGIALKALPVPTPPPAGYKRLLVDVADGNFYVQSSDGSTLALGGVGPTGPAGADGNTILFGVVDPTTEGVDGNFYIRTDTSVFFGPKAAGVWPAGVSLIGPTGDVGPEGPSGEDGLDGAVGPAGADGADGNTILYGVVDPTTEGVDGDSYIRTDTSTFFGPKAAGTWPAGVSLIGATGATGATGPAGPGLPVGGTAGQAALKVDGIDYNTAWGDVLQPADDAASLGSGAATDGQVLTADGVGGAAWEAIPKQPVPIIIACSDETTDLTTGVAKVTFRMPFAGTLNSVKIDTTEAPTGSGITVDLNEAGVSVLSTLLTIDASEDTSATAAVPAVISDSALADNAKMTVDIDAVGSTTPGKGLKLTMMVTPT